MSLRLFISSISGNMKIKERQAYVKRILDSLGVPYEEIDISEACNAQQKAEMQELARSHGKPVVPPHLMRGQVYLGDGEDFYQAVEVDSVSAFLQLSTATGETTADSEKDSGDILDREKT